MIKKITLALAVLVLQSCKKDTVKTIENTAEYSAVTVQDSGSDSVSVTSSLRLEAFPMPAEVEGCSCYFAENKENFESENYVYADDYGNSAYLKIDGTMIKIPMDEGDFDPSVFSKTIENKAYKVTMTGNKISELDETMMFRGQMTVENLKNGDKISTPIYGECGC